MQILEFFFFTLEQNGHSGLNKNKFQTKTARKNLITYKNQGRKIYFTSKTQIFIFISERTEEKEEKHKNENNIPKYKYFSCSLIFSLYLGYSFKCSGKWLSVYKTYKISHLRKMWTLERVLMDLFRLRSVGLSIQI